MTKLPENHAYHQLKTFFASELAQKATAPLKNGVEIAIYIDGASPVTLAKSGGRMDLFPTPPLKPEMSYWVSSSAVQELVNADAKDIGDIGIAIIKLLIHADLKTRITARVHIGPLALLTHGYLGILPLGGKKVMGYLAEKGFANLGQIKAAIEKLRSKE